MRFRGWDRLMDFNRGVIGKAIRQNAGASILETALVVPILLLLTCGAVDIGRAYCAAIEVSSASHAGALYGVQNPTDISGMETAADNDATDIPDLRSSAVYGCECAGSTAGIVSCTSVPDCLANYVTYVSVTSSMTFKPLIGYPGIPNSIVLSRTTRMRAGGD